MKVRRGVAVFIRGRPAQLCLRFTEPKEGVLVCPLTWTQWVHPETWESRSTFSWSSRPFLIVWPPTNPSPPASWPNFAHVSSHLDTR